MEVVTRAAPRRALRVAEVLLSGIDDVEAHLGDLAEAWAVRDREMGAERAARWLRAEVVRSAPWWIWMHASAWSPSQRRRVCLEAAANSAVTIVGLVSVNVLLSRFVAGAFGANGCAAFVSLSLGGSALVAHGLGRFYYGPRPAAVARSAVAALLVVAIVTVWAALPFGRAPALYLLSAAIVAGSALLSGAALAVAHRAR